MSTSATHLCPARPVNQRGGAMTRTFSLPTLLLVGLLPTSPRTADPTNTIYHGGEMMRAMANAPAVLEGYLSLIGFFQGQDLFEVNNHEQPTQDSHRDRSFAGDRRGHRERVC